MGDRLDSAYEAFKEGDVPEQVEAAAEPFAAAYTAKPSDPPNFSAKAHDTFLASVGQRLGIPYPVGARVTTPWRWVASIGEFDGTVKGGLRDILDALCKGVDGLKIHLDRNSADILQLKQDVEVLKEAPPARPFP